MALPSAEARYNLVRLCRRLASEFSTDELKAICSEFGVVPDRIGFNDPTLALEAIVTLVSQINQLGRVEDLMAASSRLRPGAATTEWVGSPDNHWTPRSLPESVIAQVDAEMRVPGKPYSVLILDNPQYKVPYRTLPTGCYCWPIEVETEPADLMMEEYVAYWESRPKLNPQLERVRSLVTPESALAYLGYDCSWGPHGLSSFPCLVVAPTTDQLDIVRIEQTSGGNYDFDLNTLVDQLASVDDTFDIEIVGANAGSVDFRFRRELSEGELTEVNQWLQDFAPDTELPPTWEGVVHLWWD